MGGRGGSGHEVPKQDFAFHASRNKNYVFMFLENRSLTKSYKK